MKSTIVTSLYCGLFIVLCAFVNVYGVHDKVAIIAIPKAGTHMVMKCIRLLTNKSFVNQRSYVTFEPGLPVLRHGVLVSHAVYNTSNVAIARQSNTKVIFIYRDPRDQLVSKVFWIYDLAAREAFYRQASGRTFNDLLYDLIVDGSKLESVFKSEFGVVCPVSIKGLYDAYLPWRNEPFVYTTTFEKLVGPQGGGSRELQLNEIKNIAHHIGVTITEQDAERVADELFGGSGTFRAGQQGGWRPHFAHRHIEAFKNIAGQLLVDLGYEQNFDW